MITLEQILQLILALGVGLLVGMERGWKERSAEEGSRTAGIRTFGFIGLMGGVSGLLTHEYGYPILITSFFSFTLLILFAYLIQVKKENDIGITTSIASMITFFAGVLALIDYMAISAGLAVITTFMLSVKPQLHRFLQKIEQHELLAGIKLLLITVVVLPVLPNKSYGPWNAINPFEIWLLVILIVSISFVGYISLKITGKRFGIMFTSIMGGLASSTALTISFGKLAQKTDQNTMIAGGVLAASGIMFPRVLLEVIFVNHDLIVPLLIPFGGMALASFLFAVWVWKHTNEQVETDSLTFTSPFELSFALKFGLLLTVIIVISKAFSQWFGDSGLYTISFISGIADVDAITLTISRMQENQIDYNTAVRAITLAAIANTLSKAIIFTYISGWRTGKKVLNAILFVVSIGALLTFVV